MKREKKTNLMVLCIAVVFLSVFTKYIAILSGDTGAFFFLTANAEEQQGDITSIDNQSESGEKTEETDKGYSASDLYNYACGIIDAYGGTDTIGNPDNASATGDWFVIGAAGLGLEGMDSYLSSVESRAATLYENPTSVQPTEWHRLSLVCIALGETPTAISGHDLIADGTYNSEQYQDLERQGINAYIWGLIALDASDTFVPSDADWNRETLVEHILALQLSDGGFSLTGSSDADITAMALQALSPYVGNASAELDSGLQSRVDTAVNAALDWLSENQLENGDYQSMGTANAESTAQVIIALCALDIDPGQDSRFLKNGNSAVDGLLQYRTEEGSFAHVGNKRGNGLASAQSLLALTALWRYADGQSFLYRMTAQAQTVEEDEPETTEEQAEITDKTDVNRQEMTSSTESASVVETETFVSQETASETEETDITERNIEPASTQGRNAKSIARIVLTILFLMVLVTIFALGCWKPESENAYIRFLKGRKLRNILIVCAALLLVALILLHQNFESVEEHHSGDAGESITEAEQPKTASDSLNEADGEGDNCTVTVEIRCTTVLDKIDRLPLGLQEEGVLPEDGIMLAETEVVCDAGDTAFDCLLDVTASYGIEMEYRGGGDSVYIEGIGYLYEKNAGDLSGWMYSVNGVRPGVSCGEYLLEDGDCIVWEYTCNLGDDLK